MHLAANTSESCVERALTKLVGIGSAFDYAAVQALAQPVEPTIPMVSIGTPDIASYDDLLVAGGER